eukprot:2606679-Pyramimonas_sp.AAC.1
MKEAVWMWANVAAGGAAGGGPLVSAHAAVQMEGELGRVVAASFLWTSCLALTLRKRLSRSWAHGLCLIGPS